VLPLLHSHRHLRELLLLERMLPRRLQVQVFLLLQEVQFLLHLVGFHLLLAKGRLLKGSQQPKEKMKGLLKKKN
jgi:hypothetical protein